MLNDSSRKHHERQAWRFQSKARHAHEDMEIMRRRAYENEEFDDPIYVWLISGLQEKSAKLSQIAREHLFKLIDDK